MFEFGHRVVEAGFFFDRGENQPAPRSGEPESMWSRFSFQGTAPEAPGAAADAKKTPFNVTGQLALAMMSGISSGGLPLSIQFVGRYFAEPTLFQVTREWERATGTDNKHPAVE
jgi:Asp-tRNA(Asn)/Glu-tRNA(Gln) amidotransferase A subunit family amidase